MFVHGAICFLRWSRACPELEDELPQFADKVDGIEGSLEIKSPSAGFHYDYRIPGTSMIYHCSDGFDLGDNTNPDQVLLCQANMRVDFSQVKRCKRKRSFEIKCFVKGSFFSQEMC